MNCNLEKTPHETQTIRTTLQVIALEVYLERDQYAQYFSPNRPKEGRTYKRFSESTPNTTDTDRRLKCTASFFMFYSILSSNAV